MADLEFSCPHCGQALEAPPEMAGDTLPCPACEGEMTVPGPGPGATPEPEPAPNADGGEADGACPGCGAELGPEEVLCVQCGFHRGLGKVLATELS